MWLRYALARIRTGFMSPAHAQAWAMAHNLDPTRVAYGNFVASLRHPSYGCPVDKPR